MGVMEVAKAVAMRDKDIFLKMCEQSRCVLEEAFRLERNAHYISHHALRRQGSPSYSLLISLFNATIQPSGTQVKSYVVFN